MTLKVERKLQGLFDPGPVPDVLLLGDFNSVTVTYMHDMYRGTNDEQRQAIHLVDLMNKFLLLISPVQCYTGAASLYK